MAVRRDGVCAALGVRVYRGEDADLSYETNPVLCVYCQNGRHDQCVSHRTGFVFCLCPASVDGVEPMTLERTRAAMR